MPGTQKDSLNTKLQELRSALTGEDISRIRSLTEELQKEFAQVSQATAQSAGPAGPQAGGPAPDQSNGASDGDVVDGEFTEK
jgi:molecular chaperone DnaK